jgi:hypothetical protein
MFGVVQERLKFVFLCIVIYLHQRIRLQFNLEFGIRAVVRVDENLCFFIGKRIVVVIVVDGHCAGGLSFASGGFTPDRSIGEESDEETELRVRLVGRFWT